MGSQDEEATVEHSGHSGAPSGTRQRQPLPQLHHLLIGNQIRRHADTEQLWWPSVQTLTTPVFTP